MNHLLEKKFKSKIDVWLFLVFLLTSICMIMNLVDEITQKNTYKSIAYVVVFIFFSIVIWYPFFTTQYLIIGDKIKIQSGFFKWSIKISDIKRISNITNFKASPALSLDRIKIEYKNKDELFISPKNKDEFIKELKIKNNHIL